MVNKCYSTRFVLFHMKIYTMHAFNIGLGDMAKKTIKIKLFTSVNCHWCLHRQNTKQINKLPLDAFIKIHRKMVQMMAANTLNTNVIRHQTVEKEELKYKPNY